jgi:hypothetical protein
MRAGKRSKCMGFCCSVGAGMQNTPACRRAGGWPTTPASAAHIACEVVPARRVVQLNAGNRVIVDLPAIRDVPFVLVQLQQLGLGVRQGGWRLTTVQGRLQERDLLLLPQSARAQRNPWPAKPRRRAGPASLTCSPSSTASRSGST